MSSYTHLRAGSARPRRILLASALIASSASIPALAQIEEVLVTAQKRTENLQSVPIAVSAVTHETLENAGIDHSLLDLEFVTPGLQTTQVVSGFAPRIRAIGSTDSTPGNESSVSVYMDGVYIPGPASGLVSLSNIQRVEVLKGPQGTLFGRNTTGGLIHVITRDPAHETGGTLSVSYGKYDELVVSGYATTGLSDNLAVDIAGRWEKQSDSWGTNIYDGSDAYKRENQTVRSKALWTPGTRTVVTLAADYLEYDNDVAPFRLEDPSDFYNYNQSLNSVMPGEVWGVSAKVEHDFDFGTLVSISAYRDLDQSTSLDIDLGPTDFQHAFFQSYGKSFSQEFQLLSPDSSRLQWIVGAFYFERESAFDPVQQTGDLLGFAFSPPLDLFEAVNKQDTTSYAVFAQGTYPLLEATNLTLGIRYTDDTQDYEGFSRAYPKSGMPAVIVSDTIKDDLEADEMTYRVVLDHRFTDDVMAYLSYNRGFKSGYFNISGFPSDSADPEILDAYEIGIKSEFLDNRVRLNGAVYYYDFQDLQSIYLLQGVAVGVNAGSATVQGLEMDMVAAPTANWNVRVGFNWMWEAKYDEFDPCPGPQNPPWAFPPGSASYECNGSDMINAPEWDISMGTDYTLPTSVGDFTFSVAYQYMDEFPWDADFGIVTAGDLVYNPDGVFIQPSRHLINAQVRWTSSSEQLALTLWGRNLTDEEYLVNGNQTSGAGQVGMPAEPMTYGVKLDWYF